MYNTKSLSRTIDWSQFKIYWCEFAKINGPDSISYSERITQSSDPVVVFSGHIPGVNAANVVPYDCIHADFNMAFDGSQFYYIQWYSVVGEIYYAKLYKIEMSKTNLEILLTKLQQKLL